MLDAVIDVTCPNATTMFLGEIDGMVTLDDEEQQANSATADPSTSHSAGACVQGRLTDPFVGRLSYVRAYSGRVAGGSGAYVKNSTEG